MGKKNPFVITIGFKKEDPDHIQVAELLNSMGRVKAQYIVKAVLAYQGLQQKEGGMRCNINQVNYDIVKQIVLQVLEEREGKVYSSSSVRKMPEKEKEQSKNILEDFDENTLSGILESISAFKEQ